MPDRVSGADAHRPGTQPARLPADVVGAVLLVLLGVAVLGLASTGQLTLYVHPRYLGLSVIMAAVAVVLGTLGLALQRHGEGAAVVEEHGHPHGSAPVDVPPRPGSRRRSVPRLVLLLQVLLLALVTGSVLVLPPSTLSASLRSDRGLSPVSGPGLESSAEELVGADPTTFTVRDWALLLQQGDPGAVVGQPVDLTGYVLDRGQDDVFYVARLMISCCAVDAQPIGVAVRSPGWRAGLRPDSWVRVRGTFIDSTGAAQDLAPAVVDASSVSPADEPKNPYVF